VRAVATAFGVTSVPSWKAASRRVNSQLRSFSRLHDSASAGAAAPLASRRVRPSVTPSRLRSVASAPYGLKFSAGGKASATLSREPFALSEDSSPPSEAKQPVSRGASSRPATNRRRRGRERMVSFFVGGERDS
jgi:hypothetical protein